MLAVFIICYFVYSVDNLLHIGGIAAVIAKPLYVDAGVEVVFEILKSLQLLRYYCFGILKSFFAQNVIEYKSYGNGQ